MAQQYLQGCGLELGDAAAFNLDPVLRRREPGRESTIGRALIKLGGGSHVQEALDLL
mgnify:CR=1 FL=1